MHHKKHLMIMLLGCGVMFIGVFLLKKFTDVSWGWLLLLACPLAHVFMMKGMHQNKPNPTKSDKDEYIIHQ